jgi:threonine dehydratase
MIFNPTCTMSERPPAIGDIRAAAERLRGIIYNTPIEHSPWLSAIAGVPVYLKLECFQRTRSFKMRGAYNAVALLSEEQRARGIVTASAGSHGQAIALSASLLGTQATVFVPMNTPVVKKNRIKSFGAVLDETSANYDEAETRAMDAARESGGVFINAFSDFNVVAGQGTIGLEILDAMPDIAHVIAPVGGGGMSTGIGIVLQALKPSVQLHVVQSDETRAMFDAFAAGRIVDSPITPTIAEGLAGCTDAQAFSWLSTLVSRVELVPESSLAVAMRGLFASAGIVAEGAGAVSVAAVMEKKIALNGPTVAVISGGNVDNERLVEILIA